MANPLKMLKLKPTGFQTIQEVSISAPPKAVWATILNISSWFYFSPEAPKASTHTLEAKPGGRWFIEEDGVSSLFAIVTHIEPEKLLRLSGPVGLSHLPVCNAFIFELQPKPNNKTLLRVCQRTFGYITSDIKKNYSGGWKKLFGQLKAAAENK